MAVSHSGSHLAVGCEDGSVRVFDISDGGLSYQRTLEMQPGRVLSLAWHRSDRVLVAGTAKGHLRKYNVTSGRLVQRINVDSAARQESALVWSVVVLADGTVVTGDSLGHVQFWDGELGTLLQNVATHEADVLCLAAADDGSVVFASGIDSKVVQLTPLYEGGADGSSAVGAPARRVSRWLITAANRAHTHDVRALALCGSDLLLSGGVDTQLITYTLSHFRKPTGAVRINPLRSATSLVSVSNARRIVCLQYPHQLQLFRVGSALAGDASMGESDAVEVLDSTPRRKLAEISLKGGRKIVCGAIAPSGDWAVAGDGVRLRLFRIHHDAPGDGVRVERVPHAIDGLDATVKVAFSPDGGRLVAATATRALLVVDLASMAVLRTVERPDGDALRSLEVSADGQWFAAGDVKNNIHVYSLEGHASCALPVFDVPHVAIAFHPVGHHLLAVVCLQNRLYLFDVEERRLTETSRDASVRLQNAVARTHGDKQVIGVTFNPADAACVLAYGLSFICKVDLRRAVDRVEVVKKRSSKKKRAEEEEGSEEEEGTEAKEKSTGVTTVRKLLVFWVVLVCVLVNFVYF